MLVAHGEYRFICDADLSMPIEDLAKFLPPVSGDFDIAIGSREAPGAIRYNEPPYRHIGGRAINLAIRFFILPGLQDTQCGFKCFRAETTQMLFEQQTQMGWSFDIELLYLARRKKLRIREIPIHWYFDAGSKVNAIRDALRMISDIFRIHLNAMRRGDQVLFYESVTTKAVVGIAEVTKTAFPDTTADEPGWIAVELKAVAALPAPVTLAQIKSTPALANIGLLRQSRLSVMPLAAMEHAAILRLAKSQV